MGSHRLEGHTRSAHLERLFSLENMGMLCGRELMANRVVNLTHNGRFLRLSRAGPKHSALIFASLQRLFTFVAGRMNVEDRVTMRE